MWIRIDDKIENLDEIIGFFVDDQEYTGYWGLKIRYRIGEEFNQWCPMTGTRDEMVGVLDSISKLLATGTNLIILDGKNKTARVP